MAYAASAQEEFTKRIKELDREVSDFNRRISTMKVEVGDMERKRDMAERKRRQYEFAIKLLDGEVDPPAVAVPLAITAPR